MLSNTPFKTSLRLTNIQRLYFLTSLRIEIFVIAIIRPDGWSFCRGIMRLNDFPSLLLRDFSIDMSDGRLNQKRRHTLVINILHPMAVAHASARARFPGSLALK